MQTPPKQNLIVEGVLVANDGAPTPSQIADLASVQHLRRAGVDFKVVVLPENPHSADATAAACGCNLSQVLKALLFVGSGGAVLAVVPGDRKVSVRKLGRLAQVADIRLAKAGEVTEYTRSPIGQVSPFTALSGGVKVLDTSVLLLNRVFVGSGLEGVILSLNCDALKSAWDGTVGEIA